MKISEMMADKESPRASEMAAAVPAGLTMELKKEWTVEMSQGERDVTWPDFVREKGYELNDAGHVVAPRK
jgi:hypothetical protein